MSDPVYLKQGDAYGWLKDNGYDLARSTFNNHWNGMVKLKTPLRVDFAKKVVHIDSLKVYAAGLSKQDVSREADEAERISLDLRKLKAEVQAAENKAVREELANRKDDERWMLKEDAWCQMAALVGTLRDSLRHHFHMGQGRLVHLAGGDQARGPELYEGVEEIIAKAFNELERGGRIDVVFEGEEE